MTLYPRAENDWYVEPQYVTERLIAVERSFLGHVLDPCCGQGNIGNVFARFRDEGIINFDIRQGEDFRNSIPLHSKELASVVTNPPYNAAQELAELALQHTRDRVCLFLRLAFLEGKKRSLWLEKTPLARVWVMPDRVSCCPGHLVGQPQKNGGKVAYAWFVWEHGHTAPPEIKWLHPPRSEKTL